MDLTWKYANIDVDDGETPEPDPGPDPFPDEPSDKFGVIRDMYYIANAALGELGLTADVVTSFKRSETLPESGYVDITNYDLGDCSSVYLYNEGNVLYYYCESFDIHCDDEDSPFFKSAFEAFKNSLQEVALPGIKSVSDFDDFVAGCTKLTKVNISQSDYSGSTEFPYAFQDTNALKNIYFNQNIIIYPISTRAMFRISNGGVDSLTSIDLSSFRLDNCTDINQMFRYRTNVQSIEFYNYTPENLTDYSGVFSHMDNLKTITTNQEFADFLTTNKSEVYLEDNVQFIIKDINSNTQ